MSFRVTAVAGSQSGFNNGTWSYTVPEGTAAEEVDDTVSVWVTVSCSVIVAVGCSVVVI